MYPSTVALRIRLIDEEKSELVKAIADGDRIDQLDALCDLQYVLAGAVLHLGLRALYEKNGGQCGFVHSQPLNLSANAALRIRCHLISIKAFSLAWATPEKAVAKLTEIQSILDGLIAKLGFANVFDEAFCAVDANNHAKMWTEQQVSDWQFEHIGIADDYTFTPGDGGYIAKDAMGKVIKPENHPRVDLSRFCK